MNMYNITFWGKWQYKWRKKGGSKQRLCSILLVFELWCVNIQTRFIYALFYTWCFMHRMGTYPARSWHIHNQVILRGVLGLKTYIEERAVEVAKFMITTNATVRETETMCWINHILVYIERKNKTKQKTKQWIQFPLGMRYLWS